MKKIAITGGIGSGKTYISNMFFKLGIPVYNSDEQAKRIIESNIDLKHALIINFGKDCFSNGNLNKKYISSLIFNDKHQLKLINSIVHPFVHDDFNNWLIIQKSAYTIYESAIIYESEVEHDFDKIIGIISPRDLRNTRLLSRGMDSLSIKNVMDNQISDSTIANLSDFVIYNDLNNDLNNDVNDIHSEILNYC
jgi:dephospho-CoA kinase